MSTLLTNKINMLTPEDEAFTIFIRDYVEHLKENAEETLFAESDVTKYTNRMNTFYINNNVGPGYIWIAHLVNKTDLFTTPRAGTTIYIPLVSTITDVYRAYRT